MLQKYFCHVRQCDIYFFVGDRVYMAQSLMTVLKSHYYEA